MKKTTGLLAILTLLFPALSFADGLSFRLGYFVPRAQSDLWQIEFENMTFTKSSFQSAALGIFYEHFFTREISIQVGVESYSRIQVGDYRDYVGFTLDQGDFAFPAQYYDGDFLISHQFSVSITPIQASLKLTPFGRRSGVIPYFGGGISVFLWSAKLRGDMVDFSEEFVYDDPDLGEVTVYQIFPRNAREENRFAVGYHGFAGIMIPFARRLALEAEFRYQFGKGAFRDAFVDFEDFDLSGFQISVGVNYWF